MNRVLTQLHDTHNPQANEWVLSWLRRLSPGQTVLDFASGSGRHALAAAQMGLRVQAWDRDDGALASLRQQSQSAVQGVCCDLETDPWPQAAPFAAVVVSNYLFRPRWFLLPGRLAEGGLLIYQTFAQGHEQLGRPRRPDFLLAPGELLQRAQSGGLQVLDYADGVTVDEQGQPLARIQRMVAFKPSRSESGPQGLARWPVRIGPV